MEASSGSTTKVRGAAAAHEALSWLLAPSGREEAGLDPPHSRRQW